MSCTAEPQQSMATLRLKQRNAVRFLPIVRLGRKGVRVSHQEMKHFTAMMLIGDGVLALIRPKQDAVAWSHGPALWRKSMELLRRNPAATRVVAAAQISAAVWWVLHKDKVGNSQLTA
jgi:hypothetical protein